MSRTTITLTHDDAQWLEYWARGMAAASDAALADIPALLERATIVSREALGPGVVTVGSIVKLEDRRDGEECVVWLVAPGEESQLLEKVAVTSAMGLGLVGRREGDEVRVGADSHLVIRKLLYQHLVPRERRARSRSA